MFSRRSLVVSGLMLFSPLSVAFGQGAPSTSNSVHAVTDNFQQMVDLPINPILTPSVVDVVFPPEEFTSAGQVENGVAITNIQKGTLESYATNSVVLPAREFLPSIVLDATETDSATSGATLYDKNQSTYVEFALPATGVTGMRTIVVETPEPESMSGFTFFVDTNVTLPTKVGVVAVISDAEKIVLSPTAVTNRQVVFPRTFSKIWKITFWYNQPLRLTELSFSMERNNLQERHVKFLAQPNESYRLYTLSDTRVGIPASSYALSSASPVIILPVKNLVPNPYYKPTDTDADGISDAKDNCPSLANTDQEDLNQNKIGDLCEDFDFDGLANIRDNCKNLPNPDQKDTDGDGMGDKCDTQESRFTERHAWVPWAGMGIALGVLVVLFALTIKKPTNPLPEEESGS
ncbi:MAG: thrombospondin type 3 repeat-containing protein [Candidatus Moranbacteria bacterium]|nr:thrombospondin type 3 repeat-containing protein [Candidatus Moranbacteria bacterium]